ncbi:hypothetical protein HHA33_17850 [Phytobacter diazotrophicus]|uniref:hypothetical protein n=1 Tax=Phytobacter diazotrophicus TaxID=395631 RepID=UPI0014519333|nr:hypothetical protein [Phytobacter diazotrophicus]QJF18291.1 hypothetical protein HHA33_17850 [Phytobacter diazotrophicus]
MLVDYLLIGYKRDGEIKPIEHAKGDILLSDIIFEPANDDSRQHLARHFSVQVIHHNGQRYAVAVARDVSGAEINDLIKSSRMKPIPPEVHGEI